MAHSGFAFLLLNKAIWGKNWDEFVGLSSLAFQSSSSNCLVLIPQTIGKLLVLGKKWPDISTSLFAGQCLTLTNILTNHYSHRQHIELNPGADLWYWYILKDSVKLEYKLEPSHFPADINCQAAAHQRIIGDTCTLAVLETFLTQEENVSLHTGMCCLLLP